MDFSKLTYAVAASAIAGAAAFVSPASAREASGTAEQNVAPLQNSSHSGQKQASKAKHAIPSGTIQFTIKSADVGVGYTWGSGVLNYGGKIHHFSIKGGNIAAVGYSEIEGKGKVYNLKHLYHFDGSYAAVSGEATLGSGRGGQLLRNSNGVSLEIETITKGARLAGGAQALQIKLKD